MNKAASNPLRKFGLKLVDNIPWGTHLCQLYQTKQDLLEILVPYFTAGLQNNEYCLWVTSEPLDVEEAEKALKNAQPEFFGSPREKQIDIQPNSRWYGPDCKFNGEQILQRWLEEEKEAISKGFDGLRIAGNLPVIEKSLWKSNWGNIAAYEYLVNTVFAKHRIIAFCSFPLECSSGKSIIDIEHSHAGTLIKRDNNWFLVEDAGKRKERENWYRNIVQTSIDAFWIMDSEGRLIEVNGAYCDLVGYSQDELLNRKIHDLEMKGAPTEIASHIEKVRLQGHERFEARLRRRDGLPVDIEVSANCINKDGEERIFVFAHNITRRKRNEAAIKHNELRYKELANSIADSFVALDKDLRYIYWNKASEKITGIKAKDAIGRHLLEVFEEDEGTRKVADTYRKVLKTRKPCVFVDELIMNNRKVIAENHIYPSKTGISVFTKDITQRKEMQSKLEEYTQRLEDLVRIRTEKLKTAERLAAIGETAGMVGHDIRNPLQTIAGELYLTRDEVLALPENEAKKNLNESLQIIGKQVAYISKIVTDLQDYARSTIPCLEEVDLGEMLKSIMSTMIVPQDVRVTVSVKKKLPKFRCDPLYLKRILINLVTNAVQAMPSGGKLTITANYDEKNVFISVKDTGQGIPEGAKEKLFTPLFTTKAKGQGFGLAVAKKLTSALGGKITFKSVSGKGTTFIIEIPLSSV
ncbi:MAG: PAS domain S-box protein [Candidatus Bathyarchaeota archaeon]|nr:PAS domain S-box protein [Candidatus Bathyarchaeota archaeon]